jgi:hypothetical protein
MPGFLRASVLIVASAAVICGIVVFPSFSGVNMGQIEALWKDYVVAQKRLQFDISRMLGDGRPELEAVAGLQRHQQFALIELRNMRFQYVLATDPERLVYDRGLSEFAEFEWNDADDEALREANPDYAKLERWAEKNAARLAEHPDLPASGEQLVTLQRGERYRSMLERYQARMDDLESALNTISRAQKRAERTKTLKSQIGR